MKITTIIWDIGGVLERTEDPIPRRKLAARLGIPAEVVRRLRVGSTGRPRLLGQGAAGQGRGPEPKGGQHLTPRERASVDDAVVDLGEL